MVTIDNINNFVIGADPRDPRQTVWLPIETRQTHVAILGSSGVGKSQMLVDLVVSDIIAGRALTLIDPKGDLFEDIIGALSLMGEEHWPELARDLVIIDPADPACTARFNPLEVIDQGTATRQRGDLAATFRKVFGVEEGTSWRMLLVLRRATALAMEHGLTLCDLPAILTQEDLRERLVLASKDDETKRFFQSEYPTSAAQRQVWNAPVLTRLGVLLDDPAIRRFLGSPTSSFTFDDILSSKKVCLISTSKGRLGQETAGLLSGFLLSRLQLAAETRAMRAQQNRQPHTIYIDEFSNYATQAFEAFLNEARGYKISLVLAHQHVGQLPDSLRNAILSNARMKVIFRCSYEDATLLSREVAAVTGARVKNEYWKVASIGPLPIPYVHRDYYSSSEEARQNRDMLHGLEDRMMVVQVAGRGGPMLLRTVDMPVAEIARARGRARALKNVVYAQHTPGDHVLPPAAGPGDAAQAGTFEWAAGNGLLEAERE